MVFTFILILLYRSLYGKEMMDTCLSTIANFVFWIKSATQIYVNPIHFEIQLILKITLFLMRGPDDQNRWNRKNCPKFFHRVIFALWFQICNPNLCKSHTFWNTANIEKWPCFAHADLMAKIDEIWKIAWNSFIG